LEIVDSPSKIVADVLICMPSKAVAAEDNVQTTVDNFKRAHSLNKYYNNSNSLDFF